MVPLSCLPVAGLFEKMELFFHFPSFLDGDIMALRLPRSLCKIRVQKGLIVTTDLANQERFESASTWGKTC